MKPLHERMADSRCGLLRRLGKRLYWRRRRKAEQGDR